MFKVLGLFSQRVYDIHLTAQYKCVCVYMCPNIIHISKMMMMMKEMNSLSLSLGSSNIVEPLNFLAPGKTANWHHPVSIYSLLLIFHLTCYLSRFTFTSHFKFYFNFFYSFENFQLFGTFILPCALPPLLWLSYCGLFR